MNSPECTITLYKNSYNFIEWRQNGKYHRLDGPAIEWADGTKAWYINNFKMTEAEHSERIKNE